MRTIPTPDERPTMTVAEAGQLLGLGRTASYAAAKYGQIPTIKIGKRLLVPTASLRRMLGL